MSNIYKGRSYQDYINMSYHDFTAMNNEERQIALKVIGKETRKRYTQLKKGVKISSQVFSGSTSPAFRMMIDNKTGAFKHINDNAPNKRTQYIEFKRGLQFLQSKTSSLNGFREHITKSKRNLENMIYGASSKKHMTYKDYNKFWDVIDRLRDMQDSSYIFMTETKWYSSTQLISNLGVEVVDDLKNKSIDEIVNDINNKLTKEYEQKIIERNKIYDELDVNNLFTSEYDTDDVW